MCSHLLGPIDVFPDIPEGGSFFGHYKQDFSDGAKEAASHNLVPGGSVSDPSHAPSNTPSHAPSNALSLAVNNPYKKNEEKNKEEEFPTEREKIQLIELILFRAT